MAFSFSSTAGTSGVTSITVSATSRQELTDIVQNFTLSNQTKSVGLQVAQRAYVPLEKYIIFQPTGMTWNSSGDTGSLTIQSNDNWAIEADSWIQLSRYEEEHRGPVERPNTLSGNGNTIIGLRCSANTGNTRTGGISGHCLSNTALTAYTSVSQAGSYVEPTLSVSPLKTAINASGGTGFTLAVTSNQNWITYADARWVTMNTLSGSGDGSISFEVGENATDIVRESNIYVVSTASSLSATSVIVQSAQTQEEPYIIVSPTTKRIGTSGGSFTVTVSSNTEWETAVVYDGQVRSWISMDKLNGEGDDTVEVRIDPDVQESISGRSAYISFFNERYGLKVDVNIEQYDRQLNMVFYTSTDGNVVNPEITNWTEDGQAENPCRIVSNTYENGKGVIEFERNVTSVPVGAFSGCGTLETIDLPNSVSAIGYYAFINCTGFTGGDVFHYTSSFIDREDVLADFRNCGITDLVIDDYITEIPVEAFRNNYSLTSVTIGNSVAVINDFGFYDCRNLESISIPESIGEMGDYVFEYCYALNTIYSYNPTAPTLGQSVFHQVAQSGTLHYPIGSDYSSWVSALPSGWTAVGDIMPTSDYLFISPTGFTVDATGTTGNQITITSNVIYNISSNVNWITLSDSTGTGNKTITFETSSTTLTAETSGVITISNSSITKTVSVIRNGYSPFNPDKIYYTSTGGTALDPYTTNGWGANIVSNTYSDGRGVLAFDGNVTTFPYNAYSNKKALETIIIPNTVSALSAQSFIYCSKLEEVTIGSGVESVLNYTFYGCNLLNTIYAYPTTAPTLGTGVFGVASSGTLHYPSGSDYSTWISALPSGWTAVADL